ncbi:MAG TPA: zf-HC2 domain-containing protein [Tepidisphaeraceae bacterium]|jgi:anti-sigma factor RsiW|nr:zf-HC2 domain-containing protein [Tepidisphaeraceae bacterium]
MTDCTYHSRLSAYHDGELPSEAAREVESHVSACPACAAELAEIREVSDLFTEFAPQRMSRAALARTHDAVEGDSQPRLLRIAGVLAGLAASAMVIGSAWLWETPTPASHPTKIVRIGTRETAVAKAPEWEMVAMTLRADPLPVQTGVAQPEIVSEPAVADAVDWHLKFLGNGR